MRYADPRIGTNGPTIQDYSTAIDEDLQVRLVARHRLQKKDPNAAMSEPVEPIVYYVDSGTPEPIKSALIEGASWWNDAYEAAGFINAFQVIVIAGVYYCGITRSYPEYLLGMGFFVLISGIIAGRVTRQP
mgnify:CR=1 FL=1